MKRRIKYIVFSLIVLFTGNVSLFGAGKTIVKDLVCEYHTNPIGIEVARPRLSWKLESGAENVLQTAYEISVTDQSAKGNLLWSSGKVESDQSVNMEYSGPALASMQRVYWQVRVWDNKGKVSGWSDHAFWEMGILKPQEWKASWITLGSEPETEGSKPCQYFRKEFTTTKKIKSARVYITSLGLYQFFLNGKKVSTDLFTPGWTSYKKRIQYQTYDVTTMIQQNNSFGAIVGDGWFRGRVGCGSYGKKLALLAQLQLTFTDGSTELICSDESWKATTGPILLSDIYDGETYDARKEMPGWASAGFDDRRWEKAVVVDQPKSILVAPQGEVVKAIGEIKPIKLITKPKGETVFDMGQNMTGWVRLKVQGKKGDQVTLKFAEVLDKDGNFFTDNLGNAKATDVYILKGEGTETFEPHFTFHGFRFVKMEGFSNHPSLDQITGIVIHSDMKPTGSFTCSNSLINQLQHNIQWSQKDNFLDVPTDCPQRSERWGWTGDVQVFSTTAAFNFNVAPFYTKWLRDLTADQLPSGLVPHLIPDAWHGAGGAAAWADASVIVPWTTYLAYGDKRILELQYSSMKAWVDYVKNRAGEDYLWTGDQHFGDWLAFAETNSDLIATAYYSYSSGLLAKIASIIGQDEDAKKYAQLSENIKKAFQKEYLKQDGQLASNTQTAYSLALVFHLLPEDIMPKAAKWLANDVEKMGHLTTGFVGTPLLCKALSSNGYEDLAFMLLNQKECPSWLYPVTQGATTIWERWDSKKPDGSIGAEMNSFNHYAYGAIGEWLYQYIAGINIDPEHPGYKHILLSPHPGGGLTHAAAELETMYGKVKSTWTLEGSEMVYEVTVPANTTATVTLPGAKADQVLINKQTLSISKRGHFNSTTNGISLNLGSGYYKIQYHN